MAQVVATKLLHNSFVGNGSLNKPSGNGSLNNQIKPSGNGHQRLLLTVTARRAANLQAVSVKHKRRYKSLEAAVGILSPTVRRKTKIVCTIGPSTDSREMIWKLAEAGMNVARLNMSHGDHASHQKVIDLVKQYNSQSKDNVIAIMLDIKGPELTSATLPEKDIKFGVDNQVDFYAVSSVKDAQVIHELKTYLKGCGAADIQVISKIETAVFTPDLRSIITASDGAMVARRELGADMPIEDVALLQEEIIRTCHKMEKAVIVAMTVHRRPTLPEVCDIAIAVREGADALMLSAHGEFPLKAVNTVSLRTESSVGSEEEKNSIFGVLKGRFAYKGTSISYTCGTSVIVFTRTSTMAVLLSRCRDLGTIFAFTDDKRVQQKLALYRGVCPLYIKFSDDGKETFANALSVLKNEALIRENESVAVVSQFGTGEKRSEWNFDKVHEHDDESDPAFMGNFRR